MLPERDKVTAICDVTAGMHHTFFWLVTIKKALTMASAEVSSWLEHDHDSVHTGTHSQVFVDSVTNKKYKLTIQPME